MKAIITKQDFSCPALDAELNGLDWTLLDHWLILYFAVFLLKKPTLKWNAELSFGEIRRSLVPERDRMRNKFWRGQQLSSCSQTPLVGWITWECHKGGGRPTQRINLCSQVFCYKESPFSIPHLEWRLFYGSFFTRFGLWPVQFLRHAICIPLKSKASVLNPVWRMLSLFLSHTHKQALADAEIAWLLYSLHIQ